MHADGMWVLCKRIRFAQMVIVTRTMQQRKQAAGQVKVMLPTSPRRSMHLNSQQFIFMRIA